MLKRDLYFQAMRAEAWLRKKWVISAFAVTRYDHNQKDEPYDFKYTKEGTFVLLAGDWVLITDVPPMVPVYKAMETLAIRAGEVPTLHVDVPDSTYGDVLINYRVLIYSFGTKLPYMVGPISLNAVESHLAKVMKDDPLPREVRDPDAIYITDYKKYGRAVSDLAGFSQMFVPTSTEKSLQTHPDARAVRTRLLEENKDRLHDPAVVAGIQNTLVQMDKDWLKGDPSEAFFIGNKVWNTARKRMYLIHGPEAGFDEGGDAELVVNSLDEGWDISKLPAMINSLRAGSYYRGKLTALGGESVKFFLRVFQNTYISELDCGTELTVSKLVDSTNASSLIGTYRVTKTGLELIVVDNLNALIGTVIEARSPQYCKTGNSDYCQKCMGAHNSENPLGLGSGASDVGSTFMSIMMASAHAKELKTAKLKVSTFLT
jgi:hypothetical protein